MSEGTVGLPKTNHKGFYKLDSESEGKYINKGDYTVLPAVSGDGGYGGAGEYMKYPEIEVIQYEGDKKNEGLREISRKTVPEISFVTKPQEIVPETPVKGKRKGKIVVQEPVKVEPVRQTPMKNVKYKGTFGEITVPYEHAFVEGNAMVLVNSSFKYDPPQNEEGFAVEVDQEEYNVYNINLSFTIPGYPKRVTVLLVEDPV